MENSPEPENHSNHSLKQQNLKLITENLFLQQKVRLLQQQITRLLLEKKTHSVSQDHLSPKKCSHNHHNHNHSQSNRQNHGHSHHQDNSSEEQNSNELTNTVLTPAVDKAFLHTLYKTQEEINFRYFKLPIKTIKAWKKDENIDLTRYKACMLHLREIKLNVVDLVKQTWQDVEWINLPECSIDDQGWKTIVENCQKSFPDLKVIGIRWNKIETIKEGDLEHFKQLRMIDFGLESEENNPLSLKSRQIIKKFIETHPQIKIE